MSHEPRHWNQRTIRGMDSNSLLRIYDLANEYMGKCTSETERSRTSRAIERITKELQRRNVPVAN
jgi:hypothetical protein